MPHFDLTSEFQFARYEKIAEIPLEVYKKGIELKGIVRAIHSNGYMKVEHIPTYTIPKFLAKRKSVQVQMFRNYWNQPVKLSL